MGYKYYCKNLFTPREIPAFENNKIIDWDNFHLSSRAVEIEIDRKLRTRIICGYIVYKKRLSEEEAERLELIYAGEWEPKK